MRFWRAEEFRSGEPSAGVVDLGKAMIQMGMDVCQRRPRTVAVVIVGMVVLGMLLASCRAPGGVPISREAGVAMPAEPDVRVRVRAALAQTVLSGAARFEVQALGSTGPTGPKVVMSGPLTIVGTPDGLRVTDPAARARDFLGPAGIQVAGVNPDQDPKLWIRVDGAAFPGTLRLLPRTAGSSGPELPLSDASTLPSMAPTGTVLAQAQPAGKGKAPPKAPAKAPAKAAPKNAMKFDVIEVVPIETYLMGVVPSEMFPDWPLKAFQVQAVAARSYALHERQRSIDLGQDFDLEATVADQAYSGASTLSTARQAVESTRGVVLTDAGTILRAYYSSTCGGRAGSAADVWPTTRGFEFNRAGPIQGRPREHACQDSKWYRWEVTRDRLQLSQQIRQWGARAGGDVQRIGLLERVEVSRRNAADRPSRYRLTDERGRSFELTAEELRVACNTPAPGVPEVTASGAGGRVRSGDLEMAFDGATVRITGRGFGHGVGMCQYCARSFAARGVAWQESVLRFYPGARLERAY